MERFIDKKQLNSSKQKIRFAKKCIEATFEGAVEAFKEASRCHEKLEEIYKSAMNFKAVTEFAEKLAHSVIEDQERL